MIQHTYSDALVIDARASITMADEKSRKVFDDTQRNVSTIIARKQWRSPVVEEENGAGHGDEMSKW